LNNKIKPKLFTFGWPLLESISAIILVFLLVSYFPPYGEFIALLPIALIIWFKFHIGADYKVFVPLDESGFGSAMVGIKCFTEEDMNELFKLINSNQLISITLPHVSDREFRYIKNILSNFIYKKAGFSEFHKGEILKIEGKPLGKRTVYLAYRSKKTLQDSVSTLLNRGWCIEGYKGTESNLIDRLHTQTMIYHG
jgi:hypothetical protein